MDHYQRAHLLRMLFNCIQSRNTRAVYTTLHILLKIQNRSVPKSGNLITLSQFLAVSLVGLFNNLERGSNCFFPRFKPRVIPIKNWIIMVLLFWTISILNNHALGYRISMPLHILFRSGSLIISMVMSWTFFKRKYTVNQVIGVGLVTIGILISTFASATIQESTPLLEWMTGIFILTLALILTALLGQYQQLTYSTYGSQWKEGLFYIHVLSLPGFLFFHSSIMEQVQLYNTSPLISIGEMIEPWFKYGSFTKLFYSFLDGDLLKQVFIPELWGYLLLNVCTQCKLNLKIFLIRQIFV